MAILETTDLKKYYGSGENITKALDGISLKKGNGASEFKVITDFLQVQILDFIYNMSLKNEDEIVASRETRFRSF